MTLPTSGPISIFDLSGEFGGTVPDGLQEYYAGGAFVPTGTVNGVGDPIPVSPNPISIQDFYGAPGVVVADDFNDSITRLEGGLSLTDGYGFISDGNVVSSLGGIGAWVNLPGQATGADFEVTARKTGGGGTLNQPVNTPFRLDVNRSFTLTQSGDGTNIIQLEFDFRLFNTVPILLTTATKTISLTIEN